MKRPKTDSKRVISKTERVFLWLLRLFAALMCGLLLVLDRANIWPVFLRVTLNFALSLALLMLLIFALWLRVQVIRKWRGYYLFQNASGLDEEGSVEYHEAQRKIELYFVRPPFMIHIPSDESWQREMPDWAKNRKTEIIGRVKNHYAKAEILYEMTDSVYDSTKLRASRAELHLQGPPLFGSRNVEDGSSKLEAGNKGRT